MVINIIILIIISIISYKICNKSFLEKAESKNIRKSTIIIFQISFILCNLIISFIILYIILPVNNFDLILWKLFLSFFSFFFFYFLPFYLIYDLYDHNNKLWIYQTISTFVFYLISSNIIYRFFNRTYEKSLFKFSFYINYSNILEYLAFIGDIFNGIFCAYNAVNNISSLLIYPILKKGKIVKNTDSNIKKNLDEINDKISMEESRLNELNLEQDELDSENNKNTDINDNKIPFSTKRKKLTDSKRKIQKNLDILRNVQLSYEYQLDFTTRKEIKNKPDGYLSFIVKIIKIIQGFIFLSGTAMRCLTVDYKYYNYPIDLNEKSSIDDLLRKPYAKFFNFSDGFIVFVEQVYSLAIILIMFTTNFSVSKDRIMTCISYAFSYLKENKLKYHDIELIVFSILIFSYYLVCGLLIVNSMKYIHFRDRLHRYLFPGFDFENLHWCYDCPYILAASFFIVKEIVEYSNIISPKQD